MDDLDALRRLAVGLRLDAERVQLAAVRVRVVGTAPWRSPAGEAFRERVEARARALLHGADELRAAAEAVERHHAAVRGLRAAGLGRLVARAGGRGP